jgi:hypothetical protein
MNFMVATAFLCVVAAFAADYYIRFSQPFPEPVPVIESQFQPRDFVIMILDGSLGMVLKCKPPKYFVRFSNIMPRYDHQSLKDLDYGGHAPYQAIWVYDFELLKYESHD